MAVDESLVGKRLGNLQDLPDALLKHLSIKQDELEKQILAVFKDLDGIASVDEVIVGLYRRFELIPEDRRMISAKLAKMAKSGFLANVPKKKGVFKVPQGEASSNEDLA